MPINRSSYDLLPEPDLDPKWGEDYPEWQHEIRQAQAAVDAKRREEQRKEEEAKQQREAEIDAASAKDFKKVLSWLGIDANPVKGEIVLGEYLLTLSDFMDHTYMPIVARNKAELEAELAKRNSDKEKRGVRFEVLIEFADLATDQTYGIPYNNLYFNNADFVEEEFNWEKIRAALADKLDSLDERRAQWEQNRRHQEDYLKSDNSAPSPTTLAEDLLKILTQIIDDYNRGLF